MRIDEFSAPSDIDGAIDSTEQTRFLLFGFDTDLYNILWSENFRIKSEISTKLSIKSYITTTLRVESTILERGNYNG